MGQQESTCDNEIKIADRVDIGGKSEEKLICLTNDNNLRFGNRNDVTYSDWVVGKVRDFFWSVTDYFFFKGRKRKMVDVESTMEGELAKKLKISGDETAELSKAFGAQSLRETEEENGDVLPGIPASDDSYKTRTKTQIQAEISECEFFDFRIFNDDKTIQWVSGNPVMIILRGLPGSGKSKISEMLVKLYSTVNQEEPAICSADHFFTDENGEYHYVASQIHKAHEASQEAALKAIENAKKMIIVDNTNVMLWEIKKYFQLAERSPGNIYRVIVLEPQTSWAFDPHTLASKNKHGLTLDVIAKRIGCYETLSPIYYAWFLGKHDSRLLLKTSLDILQHCFENCADFLQDFYEFSSTSTVAAALAYYNREMCLSGNKSILHCTAKFCGYDNLAKKKLPALKKKGVAKDDYKAFNRALCTVQEIQIIGFFMTRETFGARVKLTNDQLNLYDQDESALQLQKRQYGRPTFSELPASEEVSTKDILRSNISLENSWNDQLSSKFTSFNSNNFYPIPGRGKRAHITLGTAPPARPVNTGLDVLKIVQQEKESSEGKIEAKTYTLPDNSSKLRSYGKGCWALYTDNVYTCDALFAGHY